MTCHTCKRMRERMTSLILRRQRYREAVRQAKEASAAHRHEGVATAEAEGTGEGSVPMPSVQEDGDRA